VKTLADDTILNKFRVREGVMGSDDSIGNYGLFLIPLNDRTTAQVIVDGGDESGWEHISVLIRYTNMRGKVTERTPTWGDMCTVKELFWDTEETVIQYHPPHSRYVDNHPHVLHLWPHVLHLWRPAKETIPMPPTFLVGLKGYDRKRTTLDRST